ncbi:MAG: KH domain-containing protein [Oscillospiraceae bacterium]|nr:KH domain-containing protein [Oscillospiraceae bacterium]
MKDLLLYIARNLVSQPDQVSVTEVGEGDDLTLELRVAPEDMGKVIGRQGRIAKEIRTVVRSYAQRKGVKVTVDIVD